MKSYINIKKFNEGIERIQECLNKAEANNRKLLAILLYNKISLN